MANNAVQWNERDENKGDRKVAIGMCIQNTSDIPPKREGYAKFVPPNRNDMQSIADITEIDEISRGGS